jgi:hypothetical protein
MADLKVDAQPDWENTENFDAEVVKEAIAEGDEKAPEVDVAADYAVAQQLSGGIVDAELAEELVKPQFEVARPEEVVTGAEVGSGGSDYLEMAKDINPTPTAVVGEVTDDLMQKAIAKGQPGQ